MEPHATAASERIAPELSGLIEGLKDRQAAFSDAARRADRSAPPETLLEFARERARFAAEIREEVLRRGAEPPDSGTLAGAARRGFANLASDLNLTSDGVRPELEECHKLEFFASRKYEELLEERDLPPGLPGILAAQLRRTEIALSFLRGLNHEETNS